MIRGMIYFKTDEKKPRAYRPAEITFNLCDHSSAPTLSRPLPACATPLQDLVSETTENCFVLPFSSVLFSPFSRKSVPAPRDPVPNQHGNSKLSCGEGKQLRWPAGRGVLLCVRTPRAQQSLLSPTRPSRVRNAAAVPVGSQQKGK